MHESEILDLNRERGISIQFMANKNNTNHDNFSKFPQGHISLQIMLCKHSVK